MTLIFQCVDCDKDADLKCFRCGGPWCKECKEAMKADPRYAVDYYPCHTCRNSPDW